jgi:4-hydroxybenzoyl-CoA reductase subunit beta
MSLSEFTLFRPRELAEALGMLDRHAASGPTHILAGGTDLLPSMRQRLFEPEYLLDIRRLRELTGIRETEEGIEIGALTTLREIEHSLLVRERCPVLTEAARSVASPVIRNMATIGGNICLDTRCLWYNQSFAWRKSCGFCIKKDGDLCHVAPGGTKCWAVFSGDTPAALLCLRARIGISSASATRLIPLCEFYTGEGDSYRQFEANELLTKVILPRSSWGYQGIYSKLRIRGSIDYPLAGVAVAVRRSNRHIEDIRVALTAVSPAPVVVPGLDSLLRNGNLDEHQAEYAGQLAARTAKPLTTSALTPEYRRQMVQVFTKRALLALTGWG